MNIREILNFTDINLSCKDNSTFLRNLYPSYDDLSETEEVKPLEDLIITSINTKIYKEHTRSSGLVFIRYILPSISEENLLKFGILWITKATQTLENNQSNISELTTACQVLADLFISCKRISDLHKQISMQNVKQCINLISHMKSKNKCGAVYYLIAVLLHHYPEVCEHSQDSIRKMMLLSIDSNQQNLVTASANCFTLLTKVTERSFKPQQKFGKHTNWIYNQLLLCNSLHIIMDQLFGDITEFISIDKYELFYDSELFELPKISEHNIVEYYNGLEQRFINLNVYLSTILRCCEGKNSVSPTHILQILSRGLAITYFNLMEKQSMKHKILLFMLPRLHMSLLATLSSFIKGFKQELVPFGHLILKLIQQTLEGTDKTVNNQATLSHCQSLKKVRLSAYQTLNVWLMYTGSLSGIETMIKYFLPFILKDVDILKNSIFLTVQNTHNSKKTLENLRDRYYENSLLENSSQEMTYSNLNADLYEEALVVIQNIFLSGNCWINVSFYEKIKNEVVNSIQDLYSEATEMNSYKVNVNCRLQLLKTLKSLQMNSNPLTPPPTQFCTEIFNMALTDANINIYKEAKLGLAEVEKIIHPSAPTLNFLPMSNFSKSENNKNTSAATTATEQEKSS